jgi:hypothetical protein
VGLGPYQIWSRLEWEKAVWHWDQEQIPTGHHLHISPQHIFITPKETEKEPTLSFLPLPVTLENTGLFCPSGSPHAGLSCEEAF